MRRVLVPSFWALLLILACSSPGWAQATFLTGSAWTSKSNYMPGVGQNRLIVVAVARRYAAGSPTVTGLTFGGLSLTQARTHNANSVRSYVFYLTEAQLQTLGNCANNFVVTWSTALGADAEMFTAITIADVDQTTPVPAANGVNSNANANASAIATGNMSAAGASDLVLYAATSNNNRTHTAAANYTQRAFATNSATLALAMATRTMAIGSTQSPSAAWVGGNSAVSNIGVVFNGVASNKTYYSYASGAWDANTTWSLSENGASGTLASGIWPTRTDNVIIKSGHTVTIDALDDNKGCAVSASGLGFANVGQGSGGGAAFDNSATTNFYHIGDITVRGTLQMTGGANNMMTLGTTTVVAGGTFTVNSNYYNLGYFEVQSGANFSTIGNFIISGSSRSLVDAAITIGNDFGVDWTNATICGTGSQTLTLGAGSAIVYTNGATVAQICSSYTSSCTGIGCSGFPTTGTGVVLVGNTGPAGVGNATNNKLWLRSTDISQANGSAVSAWTDASGNGNNASQGSAGNMPTFSTNLVNGTVPGVTFLGSSLQYLTLGQPASLDFIPQVDAFTFIAASRASTGASGTIIGKAGSVLGDRQYQFSYDLGAANRFGTFKGGSFATGNQVSTNAWKIPVGVIGTNATTGHSAYVNGAAETLTGTAVGASTIAMDVTIGARRNANNTDAAFPLTGDIGEIIMYNTGLADIYRTLIENYLAAKFNITGLTTELYTGDAAGYDFDVAGIGMLAGIAHTDSKGPGVTRVWNPSALANGDYLMWGHDNASLTSISSDVDGVSVAERLTRIWFVTETNDVGTVNLSIDVSVFPDAVGTGLRLLIDRDNNFATNDVPLITGSFSNGTVTFSGVDFQTNDRFTLGNTNMINPLPIELINFAAHREKDAVRLDWITLTEINNDYFTVERSLDGESWEDIVSVRGAGTTNKKHNYTAYDEQPQNGLSYYRIKQTDFDGSFAHSYVVRIQLEGIVSLKVYPNPSSNTFTVTGSENIAASVLMLDVLGRPVSPNIAAVDGGWIVNTEEIPAGVYFLQIITPNWKRVVRIVKQ
jgi:hypothetical protein